MPATTRPTTHEDVHKWLLQRAENDRYFRECHSNPSAYLLGMCEVLLAQAYRELQHAEIERGRLQTALDEAVEQ